MKKKLTTILALGTIALGTAGFSQAASYADIAFVVDQSGSMYDEFDWIANSITAIQTAMTNAGITTNYGLAGYEYSAGTEYYYNAFQDISSDASLTVDAANYAKTHLYGSQERGYHAADWSISGFNWTGGDYAKVVVLLTDESADQGSGITEAALGQKMDNEGLLLNVITYQGYFTQWDDAVFDQNNPYQGLFDLNYLKNDPTGFTADFTAAKITEIINNPPQVPEPSTILLMGVGLAGLLGYRRKKHA